LVDTDRVGRLPPGRLDEGGLSSSALHPLPHTLYPTTYTVYPTNYTVYRIPHTVYRIPHTLYPASPDRLPSSTSANLGSSLNTFVSSLHWTLARSPVSMFFLQMPGSASLHMGSEPRCSEAEPGIQEKGFTRKGFKSHPLRSREHF